MERCPHAPDDHSASVVPWVSALETVRARTLRTVDGLTGAQLDLVTPASQNSLGTLLYHVAHAEMWWLERLLGETHGADVDDLLPHAYPVDVQHPLPAVLGEPPVRHIVRLATTRAVFLERIRSMDEDEFHRRRDRDGHAISPRWVMQHVTEHEAHHRGQMALIRALIDGRRTR